MTRVLGEGLHRDDSIRKILVVKWSAMGDVALASAALEDVFRAFPGREIHLNTLPAWAGMFRHDPRISRIIAPDLRARDGSRLAAMGHWLRAVRAQRYDLVIDLQTTDRSRLLLSLLWLTGGQIRHRVGNKRAFPYTVAPASDAGPRHALEITRRTLEAAGIPARTERPVLHPSAGNRARVERLRRKHGLRAGGYAALLPGSQAAGALKRWGAARYAVLARELLTTGISRVVIIGGPDDLHECRAVHRAAGDARVVNLCGETELLEVALLCAGARVVVANDTGSAHLAAAAARPMVVICGPTDPRRVRPAGANVTTVQAQIPCINCYRKSCPHHSCMKMITPSMVMERLRR